MPRGSEIREQQAIRRTWPIVSKRAFTFVMCVGLIWPGMLLAQSQPAQTASQPATTAAYSQSQTTFTQQPAPAESAPVRRRAQYTLPENECSADFWNPYEREASAITESPARVQQSSVAGINPGDTVQELPGQVVDPAQGVQPLNGLLVQSLPRVQQLESEVIRPAVGVQEHYGERLAAVPSPDPDFPLPLPVN